MIKQLLRVFLANEDGATAVEYALIAALIAIAIIASVRMIGEELIEPFQTTAEAIEAANATVP